MVSRIMTYDSEPFRLPTLLAGHLSASSLTLAAESRICPFRWSSCKRFARPFGIQSLVDRGAPIGRDDT